MEDKKQIENGQLTKVYHTNHIVEAITVEKRCTGIARYRKSLNFGNPVALFK